MAAAAAAAAAADLSPAHGSAVGSDGTHMAYGCKVTILRAARKGLVHGPDSTCPSETVLVVNSGFRVLLETPELRNALGCVCREPLVWQSVPCLLRGQRCVLFVLGRFGATAEAFLRPLPPSPRRPSQEEVLPPTGHRGRPRHAPPPPSTAARSPRSVRRVPRLPAPGERANGQKKRRAERGWPRRGGGREGPGSRHQGTFRRTRIWKPDRVMIMVKTSAVPQSPPVGRARGPRRPPPRCKVRAPPLWPFTKDWTFCFFFPT